MPTRLVTLRMEEELADRLAELARLRQVTRSRLIKELLRTALERSSSSGIQEALSALRRGRKPQRRIEWTRIEQELRETKPVFVTLEEAMVYSRRRMLRKNRKR